MSAACSTVPDYMVFIAMGGILALVLLWEMVPRLYAMHLLAKYGSKHDGHQP